jgi:hypothetical protein
VGDVIGLPLQSLVQKRVESTARSYCNYEYKIGTGTKEEKNGVGQSRHLSADAEREMLLIIAANTKEFIEIAPDEEGSCVNIGKLPLVRLGRLTPKASANLLQTVIDNSPGLFHKCEWARMVTMTFC